MSRIKEVKSVRENERVWYKGSKKLARAEKKRIKQEELSVRQDLPDDYSEASEIVVFQPRSKKQKNPLQHRPGGYFSEKQARNFSYALDGFVDEAIVLQEQASKLGDTNILEGFRETSEYRPFIDHARQVYSSALSEDDYLQRFSGALFARVAHLYLYEHMPQGHVLIGPNETFMLQCMLYPHSREMENPFESSGLDGHYVPDALEVCVDTRTVSRVMDTTLSLYEDKQQKQLHGFYLMKKRAPELFDNAIFTFVIPKTKELERRIIPGIEPQELPFDRLDFSFFLRQIYRDEIKKPFTAVPRAPEHTLEALQKKFTLR